MDNDASIKLLINEPIAWLVMVGLLLTGIMLGWFLGAGDRKRARQAEVTLAVEGARMEAMETAHREKLHALDEVRHQIEKDLKLLTQDLLDKNSAAFLERMAKSMESREEIAKQNISALVNPINEGLKAYHEHLKKVEAERLRDEGALNQQLKGLAASQERLNTETGRLVNALKAAPKTRGRWGEQQLRSVMEIAGMTEHVDFQLEQSMDGEDGRLRPDAIIRLPQGRKLVVDAKTPMHAYLEAIDEVDEEKRELRLKDHARQARTHMKQLASKSYWSHLNDAADYVVMFIPGENLFTAAVERDPDLLVDGIDQRVLITTPTTFVALAHVVAAGWRQEKLAENAVRIGVLGRELHDRMAIMGDRMGKLSTHLDRTVRAHNELVATLESRVLPSARKFQELGIAQSEHDIADLQQVETGIRFMRGDEEKISEGTRDDS
ncbi:MAG TPA: DNA recombination protein RmuC [Alphaproteobacteria bacterium]|nr:DNA recombination protein RmuC [Alphaproteobacteria bacterium]